MGTHTSEDHSHDHDHEGCQGHDHSHDHDHTHDEEDTAAKTGDPEVLEAFKSKYPEPLWTYLTQTEMTPSVDDVFDGLTGFDNLKENHLEDLKAMALDDEIWSLSAHDEPVGRAIHLAFQTLAAMGIDDVGYMEKAAVYLDEEERLDIFRQRGLQTLFAKNVDTALEGLLRVYDNSTSNARLRFRLLYNLLPLQLKDGVPKSVLHRIQDFLGNTQHGDESEIKSHNTELIDLLCLTVETTQDPSLLEVLPAIEEVYAENRIDAEHYPLNHVEAAFGDVELSVEDLQEQFPSNTVYLRCESCYRIYPFTTEKAYIDPIVLHANISPIDELEPEEREARKVKAMWIPEPVTCPDCGEVDIYDLSIRGVKRALAGFIRQVIAGEQGTVENSIYEIMEFKTLGQYIHPLDAIEGCKRSLEQYPKAVGMRIELARFLTHQNKFDEAYENLLQAVEDDPTEPGSYHGLAMVSEAMGNEEQAVEWWVRLQNQLSLMEVSQAERRRLRKLVEESLVRLKGPKFAAQQVKTKVGRNDPCPCGSGKKFKKCCMR